MNNDICELSFGELEAVSGGKDKGASGGLDAAKSIDISKLLAALDKALAAARRMEFSASTVPDDKRPPRFGGLFAVVLHR